jgi:hypothetical protein
MKISLSLLIVGTIASAALADVDRRNTDFMDYTGEGLVHSDGNKLRGGTTDGRTITGTNTAGDLYASYGNALGGSNGSQRGGDLSGDLHGSQLGSRQIDGSTATEGGRQSANGDGSEPGDGGNGDESVPAPGAIALFGLAGIAARRRRA